MKTLIISNNKLSYFRNNGKTIAAIFSEHKVSDIYQISIHKDKYDLRIKNGYTLGLLGLRKDDDILAKIEPSAKLASLFPLNKSSNASKEKLVFNGVDSLINKIKRYMISSLREFSIFYFARDFLYLFSILISIGRVNKLIRDNSIDKVFFVYPDFFLLQKFVKHIVEKNSISLKVFVTDDYFFKYSKSLISGNHVDAGAISYKSTYAKLLKFNFNALLSGRSTLYTISPAMSKVYYDVFNVNSSCLVNCQDVYAYYSLKTSNSKSEFNLKKKIHISYFGSLHTGRYQALLEFISFVKKYNDDNQSGNTIFVDVFSSDQLNPIAYDCVLFHPGISGAELSNAFHATDYLLLIESSSNDSIDKTWLSFSTKVPEYLSSGRPIITFGPMENGSIRYLFDNELSIHCETYDIKCLDNLFDDNFYSSSSYKNRDVFNSVFSKCVMREV